MRRYRISPELTSCYYSTITVVSWLCVFKEKKYFDIIIESLNYCREHKGLRLLGFVIMLNHGHLITMNDETTSLSDIMRDFKRHTSRLISAELEHDNEKLFLYVMRKAAEGKRENAKYKVWQDEFHPKAIYSEKFFLQKLQYMHMNPVRKGLVARPEDWLYSSARNYILEDDLVISLDLEWLS